jgi:NADH-quinone oxidoreductase subunit E
MSNARSLADIKSDLASEAHKIMARYPTNRSAIMPVLDLAQQKYGIVDGAVYQTVAELLDVPEIWVFEVASFYSLYDRAHTGRHHIRLCTNLSCLLRGADVLMTHLQQRLDVGAGETTTDGSVTLSAVECLGACEVAPVLMADKQYHGDLTVEKLDALLASLADQPTKEVS